MKFLLSAGLLFLSLFTLHAQYGDFGLNEQPNDQDPVDDLLFYGELNDMSGGYHVGDTVFDFTLYDFEGNSINLYEELAGERPVVLINGSVSCVRFRNAFNSVEGHQAYYVVSQFIQNSQDLFNYIFVYGIEAHPTDGNCPSNCPNVILTDSTVVQSPDYGYRRWSLDSWNSAPEFDFPYNLYADNPDNAVYNNFFERPFGFLGIECDGTVAFRGDWVFDFLLEDSNVEQLLGWQDSYTTCGISWPESDGNGIGDEDDNDDSQDEDDENNLPSHAFEGIVNGGANTTDVYTKQDIRIFPNPGNSYITISGLESIEAVKWFNLNGQQLYVPNGHSSASVRRYDIESLTPDLYLVRVDRVPYRVSVHR